MPRLGGEADKLGNRYEGVWAVASVLDLLDSNVIAVEFEPLSPDEAEGMRGLIDISGRVS